MKKIFTLTIVLFATLGFANAQDAKDYDMYVTMTDGSVTKLKVENVEEITYAERPDEDETEGWTSLGYCRYGEDYIASVFYLSYRSDMCCEYYVEVQENNEQEGLYRLVNPYSSDIYPYASYFSYDTSNNYYIEINATDPDGVYINSQYVGLSYDYGAYGECVVYSKAAYYLDQGYDIDTIKSEGYCGTLSKGRITFPTSALLVGFVNVGYYTEANLYGNFMVDLTSAVESIGASKAKAKIQQDFNEKVPFAKIGEPKSFKNK